MVLIAGLLMGYVIGISFGAWVQDRIWQGYAKTGFKVIRNNGVYKVRQITVRNK